MIPLLVRRLARILARLLALLAGYLLLVYFTFQALKCWVSLILLSHI